MLTRRRFLTLSSLAASASFAPFRLTAQYQAASASLHIGAQKLATMPADFTGLSYEIIQLYNPAFFSSENKQLVDLFRALSPNGILRIGGNLSDLSRWKSDAGDFETEKQTAAIERGKTYWEWKLSDVKVRAARDGAITPAAVRSLRTFLDATNWRLLYGLNFGSGSPERAADEAACVAREIGNRLIAFQIGNESDFFGGNRLFRERPFGFEQYYKGIQEFTAAVRRAVPNARFAGPDTANNLGWVEQYGQAQATAPQPGKAVLLSSHYYAMGPAGNPAMNAERLLSPNPGLENQIAKVHQAVTDSAGIPFRMTEGNSCFGGGKPDVSDAFASALWVADYMLHLASSGYAGVNLHGGGDGFYTPIESLDDRTATPRPMYHGMTLAQKFAGLDLLATSLTSSANLTAYAARGKNLFQQVLINKSPDSIQVALSGEAPTTKPAETWLLSAPDLSAKTGTTLTRLPPQRSPTTLIAPFSAILTRWKT